MTPDHVYTTVQTVAKVSPRFIEVPLASKGKIWTAVPPRPRSWKYESEKKMAHGRGTRANRVTERFKYKANTKPNGGT